MFARVFYRTAITILLLFTCSTLSIAAPNSNTPIVCVESQDPAVRELVRELERHAHSNNQNIEVHFLEGAQSSGCTYRVKTSVASADCEAHLQGQDYIFQQYPHVEYQVIEVATGKELSAERDSVNRDYVSCESKFDYKGHVIAMRYVAKKSWRTLHRNIESHK